MYYRTCHYELLFKRESYNIRTSKHLLFTLILALLSAPSFSEVDITTLDDWNVFSTSPHELVVSKQGLKDTVNFLAFRMERPFCICSNPVISLASDTKVEVGSKVKGTITVDMTKPMDTVLRVLQVFKSGHVLFRPLQFPSLRTSKVVKVKTELGTTELFFTKGIDSVMAQSKRMCESDYYYEAVEPKVKEMDV